MKDYASLRNNNGRSSGLVILAVLLVVLEICSISMLFSQLSLFSTESKGTYISLTDGSANGTVQVGRLDENGNFIRTAAHASSVRPVFLASGSGAMNAVRLAGNETGFSVYDKDQVWSTQTDVDIFSVSYKNGQAEVTVNSEKGDNVFAPGTEQTYEFTLANDGKYNLDYILTVEAFYENTDGLWIPIEGRLSNPDGYVVGSAEEWPDVLELDGYKEEGKINSGRRYNYSLDWRWPFERFDGEGLDSNDAYDTMLGNLAVDKDLTLHIIIRTMAWVDEIPTGDNTNLYLWGGVAGAALVGIVVLLILMRRNGKKKDDED
ncbi:MAG: hypothetical protein II458_06655 [Oscillospiraceae bacterium]|nr:hypothetical protein [Oscillospiraceae bacterium]